MNDTITIIALFFVSEYFVYVGDKNIYFLKTVNFSLYFQTYLDILKTESTNIQIIYFILKYINGT